MLPVRLGTTPDGAHIARIRLEPAGQIQRSRASAGAVIMGQPWLPLVAGSLLRLASLVSAQPPLLEQFVSYQVLLPIQKAAEAVEKVQGSLPPASLQASNEPQRPKVPHRFEANMTFVTSDTGMPMKGEGFFAQDVDLKALRIETVRSFLLGLSTNLTTLSVGEQTWIETGGKQAMCRQLPMFGPQGFHETVLSLHTFSMLS